MKEVFLVAYLSMTPIEEPVWLSQLYESEFPSRVKCEKVISVIEENDLFDTTELHCIKVAK